MLTWVLHNLESGPVEQQTQQFVTLFKTIQLKTHFEFLTIQCEQFSNHGLLRVGRSVVKCLS